MAEGRALNLLHQNVVSTDANCCLNSFLTGASCTELPSMSYDGTRLKWTGDLSELNRIVREVWELEGKWSSPGGQSKKFSSTNCDFILTWHKGKAKSMLFKGKDGALVRDRCILICKQVTQSMLKSQLPDDGQMNSNTSVCVSSNNLSDVHEKAATDCPPLIGTIQNQTVCRLSPDSVDGHCQTEIIELNNNNCGCGCGIIAAELEGLKLELVILQKSFESKLDCFVTELAIERANVSQLKQELADEKTKNSRFESKLALLNNRIETGEVIIDQLGPLNTSINSKEACNSDINTQTKNADQELSNSKDNSGQSSMSENVDFNNFDGVVQVSSNKIHSTAHNKNELTTRIIPKHLVACPFLRKKGSCLKGSRCDFSHNVSQSCINKKNANMHSSKHLITCPFLLRKGHCLKGSRCDFSHNISQSRSSNKPNVNPVKDVIEISNDAVYPSTTLNDSNASTKFSTPNESYAIPVRITTTRRRGKRNPQKFKRRSEHFLRDMGNCNRPPELQLEDTHTWNTYLQLVKHTLDQFGTLV